MGASALMQGLADGYFVIPYTIGNYLAGVKPGGLDGSHPEAKNALERVEKRISTFLGFKGRRTVDDFHKQLGRLMWDACGMSRSQAGLRNALNRIPELREEFWSNAAIPGSSATLNQELEKAGRIADFFEFAELMCLDALERNESCGGHFREEYQTPDGEALRNDQDFSHVAIWSQGNGGVGHEMSKEPLTYENVAVGARSYK